MNHYTDLLPLEIKQFLFNYLKQYDLIPFCRESSIIYNVMCNDEKFWYKKIYSDFNWSKNSKSIRKEIQDIINKFGSKNTYIILSRLVYEYDKNRPLGYIDLNLLIGGVMAEYRVNKHIDEIVTKEETLKILMSDPETRDHIIKNIDNVNIAEYLYNVYPKYQIPILLIILLLRDKRFRLDFMNRIKKLPTFLYNQLGEIFDTISFNEEAIEGIENNFSVDSIANIFK